MAVNSSSPGSRAVACRCARPMGSIAQDGREAAPEARSPSARVMGSLAGSELGSPPSCPGCFDRSTPLTSSAARGALARLSASATAGMLGRPFCSFGAETGARRSSHRLFHHDFNRRRCNRSGFGPLEEPEQYNQRNDDMWRPQSPIRRPCGGSWIPAEGNQRRNSRDRLQEKIWTAADPARAVERYPTARTIMWTCG